MITVSCTCKGNDIFYKCRVSKELGKEMVSYTMTCSSYKCHLLVGMVEHTESPSVQNIFHLSLLSLFLFTESRQLVIFKGVWQKILLTIRMNATYRLCRWVTHWRDTIGYISLIDVMPYIVLQDFKKTVRYHLISHSISSLHHMRCLTSTIHTFQIPVQFFDQTSHPSVHLRHPYKWRSQSLVDNNSYECLLSYSRWSIAEGDICQ